MTWHRTTNKSLPRLIFETHPSTPNGMVCLCASNANVRFIFPSNTNDINITAIIILLFLVLVLVFVFGYGRVVSASNEPISLRIWLYFYWCIFIHSFSHSYSMHVAYVHTTFFLIFRQKLGPFNRMQFVNKTSDPYGVCFCALNAPNFSTIYLLYACLP